MNAKEIEDQRKAASQLRANAAALPPGLVQTQALELVASLEKQIEAAQREIPAAASEALQEKASAAPVTDDLLGNLQARGVEFRGPGDVVAVVVHTLVRRHGWVCTSKEVVQGAANVPGFAPPMRVQDLPADKAVPSKWQEGPADGSTNFTYRSAEKDEKKARAFKLATLLIDNTVMLHFGAELGRSGA